MNNPNGVTVMSNGKFDFKPQVDRIHALIKRLLTLDASQFDMNEWIIETPCGTAGCIAGWALIDQFPQYQDIKAHYSSTAFLLLFTDYYSNSSSDCYSNSMPFEDIGLSDYWETQEPHMADIFYRVRTQLFVPLEFMVNPYDKYPTPEAEAKGLTNNYLAAAVLHNFLVKQESLIESADSISDSASACFDWDAAYANWMTPEGVAKLKELYNV